MRGRLLLLPMSHVAKLCKESVKLYSSILQSAEGEISEDYTTLWIKPVLKLHLVSGIVIIAKI